MLQSTLISVTLLGLGINCVAEQKSSVGAGVSQLEIAEIKRSSWTDTQLSLKMGLSGRGVEDDLNSSRSMRIDLGIEASTQFRPWLKGVAELGFFSSGGSSTSLTGEFKPSSGIAFGSTYLQADAGKTLAVRTGFVPVGVSELNGALDENDHPGASVSLKSPEKQLAEISLTGFSVLPTSTLVTPRYFPTDGNPSMNAADLRGEIHLTEELSFGAHYARIRLNSLTASIAQDSQQLGNFTTGRDGSSRFRYEFDVEQGEIFLSVKTTPAEFTLSAAQARNLAAPVDQNTARFASLKLKLDMGSVKPTLSYSEFRIEPEVLPASVASAGLSRFNRQGRSASLGLEDARGDLSVRLSRTLMNEIYENPYQADREVWGVKFQAQYDVFAGGSK